MNISYIQMLLLPLMKSWYPDMFCGDKSDASWLVYQPWLTGKPGDGGKLETLMKQIAMEFQPHPFVGVCSIPFTIFYPHFAFLQTCPALVLLCYWELQFPSDASDASSRSIRTNLEPSYGWKVFSVFMNFTSSKSTRNWWFHVGFRWQHLVLLFQRVASLHCTPELHLSERRQYCVVTPLLYMDTQGYIQIYHQEELTLIQTYLDMFSSLILKPSVLSRRE